MLGPKANISFNLRKFWFLSISISNVSNDKPSPSAKSARPLKSAKDNNFTTPGAFITLKFSILSFEENDIGIPITVLEELDQMKKGNDTLNFEAREFIRMIDKLSVNKMLNDWIPLNGKTKGKFKILVNQKTKNNIFNIVLTRCRKNCFSSPSFNMFI